MIGGFDTLSNGAPVSYVSALPPSSSRSLRGDGSLAEPLLNMEESEEISIRRVRSGCKVVSKLIQWRLIEDNHKFFEEVEKRLRIGARCKGVPGKERELKIEVDASRRAPKNAGHREGPAYNAIRVFPRSSNFKVEERLEASNPLWSPSSLNGKDDGVVHGESRDHDKSQSV
ncbi:hypothetical protein V1478_014644 [Vespula squamosa]|uniref:Uncharacterized protein n=1 Tax=Vespula squamosa TaxID=30214 RepID=A0ABD2A2T6_VESSQ